MKYQELITLINQHDDIGLIAHFRPDGDAIGATVALGLALQSLGKTVRLYNEDSLPQGLSFMAGTELLQPLPSQLPEEMGLLICLDCGAWKRLGDRSIEILAPAREQGTSPYLVNFDHHGSNEGYGQLNIVEAHAAATCAMLYNLIKEMGVTLTPEIATALYVGINTDTGSFQFGSTSPEIMRMGAHLLEQGVDVAEVNRQLYQEVPLSTLMVNREVLSNMVVEMDGQLIHYSLDAATKERLQLSSEDSKDLVEIIRVLQGSLAAIIFEDLEDGRVRMSLRSKDTRLNVAKVAESFGGGGHHMAAGIRMRGPLAECRQRVLTGLRAAIKAL